MCGLAPFAVQHNSHYYNESAAIFMNIRREWLINHFGVFTSYRDLTFHCSGGHKASSYDIMRHLLKVREKEIHDVFIKRPAGSAHSF